MTSRERVLAAFAHKESDKVPVDFGGMCTSMVNTIHNIQANTPIENIVAMVEAVKEFNRYK